MLKLKLVTWAHLVFGGESLVLQLGGTDLLPGQTAESVMV